MRGTIRCGRLVVEKLRADVKSLARLCARV